MLTVFLALADVNNVVSVPWIFYVLVPLVDLIMYGTWSEKK